MSFTYYHFIFIYLYLFEKGAIFVLQSMSFGRR